MSAADSRWLRGCKETKMEREKIPNAKIGSESDFYTSCAKDKMAFSEINEGRISIFYLSFGAALAYCLVGRMSEVGSVGPDERHSPVVPFSVLVAVFQTQLYPEHRVYVYYRRENGTEGTRITYKHCDRYWGRGKRTDVDNVSADTIHFGARIFLYHMPPPDPIPHIPKAAK